MSRPTETHDPWPPPEALRLLTVARTIESPGSTYGPWRLDAWALTWIVEGQGRTWLDDELVETRPGTVIFMHPGQQLRHDWGRQRACQAFIIFALDRLPSPWPDDRSWPRSRQLPEDHFLFVLWRYLLSFDQEDPDSAGCMLPSLQLMLRIYLSDHDGVIAPVHATLPEAVERSAQAMHAHLRDRPTRPLRLPSLARKAHVTPQHLCRLFRQSVGLGPMECLQAMRIEKAAGLLERSDQNIGEIADALGFSSQFYFSRIFKQSYGVSPSAYRKAFRAGDATRPTGLMFRHHALRRYFYEGSPGKIS